MSDVGANSLPENAPPPAHTSTSNPQAEQVDSSRSNPSSSSNVEPSGQQRETFGMQDLSQFIAEAVAHAADLAAKAAVAQLSPLFAKQAEVVIQLGPLANIIPALSTGRRARAATSVPYDSGYDGELEDEDGNTTHILTTPPRSRRDNVFHVSGPTFCQRSISHFSFPGPLPRLFTTEGVAPQREGTPS